MRSAIAAFLVLLASSVFAQETRVALIIGNDAYTGLPKLNNAVADARAMDKKLKELGFQTTLRTNVGRVALNRALSEFATAIGGKAETVGLVFYAGHGIQAMERNWLIPIDAQLESDIDLEAEAVDAQRFLKAMDEARNTLNIVILDACRDNPLPKRQRSAERGLAIMSVAPRGSVIAYSASPNQKAQDGAPGGNGVYTGELLKALDEPGLKIEDVFKRANGGVQRATGGRQVPWFNASIQGDFYFRPGVQGSVATSAPSAPALVDPAAIELAYWNSVKDSRNAGEYEAYLKEYPKGRFVQLAEMRVAALTTKLKPTAPKPAQPSVGTFDRQPGQEFRECANCPELVLVPAGSFVMGASMGEEDRESVADSFKGLSAPQHRQQIRSFLLGKYEVTVGEFAEFANTTNLRTTGCYIWNGKKYDLHKLKNWRDPGFDQGERHPVACVSWNDAEAYLAWLSLKTSKKYRLPTEAEWEYAARAGTTTSRYWGDDGHQSCGFANVADLTAKSRVNAMSDWRTANCNDGYSYTAPVGSFKSNAFGLFDMIGNVWEWTEDCWTDNYVGAPNDGSAKTNGDCSRRVLRGGSWGMSPAGARAAHRFGGTVNDSDYGNGFRVARSLD